MGKPKSSQPRGDEKRFVWVIMLVSKIEFKKILLLANPPPKQKLGVFVFKEQTTRDVNKALRFSSEKVAQSFIERDQKAVTSSVIPLKYSPHVEYLELTPKKTRRKKTSVKTKFGVIKLHSDQKHFLDDVEAL